ncbi:MAG: 50S ribosomal protein L29 [Rothia sp. (in: high G+C Gram-positive bacteria)]|uniref:50S ribosomal protein L29 n=1 Tax=Rothia sp. (in: high G+C Gram-positive bacteria) TaxID=1885016 RepID=UPI0026DF616F|nr:50S ribosomal protein L29 [Rothia sp. (in: high G+C Gram-positive bacteria)]MDO5749957.1 50S ribosomal protein L29 [Rothia sp. (in: high G+C Gram-positive bacteria)]
MAVGSKDLSIDKLAEMTNEQLATQLSESKKELFNIRFQEVTGQASAGRRRTIKRDIARIYTVLRERELGIRTEGESK